jgi:hypothetical protein
LRGGAESLPIVLLSGGWDKLRARVPLSQPLTEEEVIDFALNIQVTEPRSVDREHGLLSYLDALTIDFERDGQAVSAVLTYAAPIPGEPGKFQAVVAAETGYEGIACVDDTARAALLALRVYERTRSRRALNLARRWLTFLPYMQYPDGDFANFIRNISGVRNATGPTSVKGGYAWSSRALWALATAYRITGDEQYLESYLRCKLAPTVDNKMNAVLALGEMELYRAGPSVEWKASIAEKISRIVEGEPEYFRDLPHDETVHLWGYHQLHAVAEAAVLLDEESLIGCCRSTVRTLIEPDVRAQFWSEFPSQDKLGLTAYMVAPIVRGLSSLYRATETKKYRDLAFRAAAWFYGRNDARVLMYDPTTGMCNDGITDGFASLNHGAESSIEAGFAELERRSLEEEE